MPPPSLLIRPPPSGCSGHGAPRSCQTAMEPFVPFTPRAGQALRGASGGDGCAGAGRGPVASGAEHLDEQRGDPAAPALAVELGWPEAALLDGVLRPREPVKRRDHVDHPAVVLAGDAGDPGPGAAVVGERALLDALPVRVLEQASGVALARPAAGHELVVAALEAAQGELEKPPAAVVLRQPLQ